MTSTVGIQRAGDSSSSSSCNWWCYKDEAEALETLQRDSRSCTASFFRRRYNSYVEGKKTFICSDGTTCSWSDKCYDKIWVGVQGKGSICVVTLNQDVDPTVVAPVYQSAAALHEQTMRKFAETIISEVECTPYDDENHERFGCGTLNRPFCVVSVIPFDEGSGHEASSAKYDAIDVIDFLMDKMKSNLAFTYEETVETAIAAFQYLCRKELKAEDIWVSAAWNLDGISWVLKLPEKKEHLDIISGVSSGEGRLPKVPPTCPGPPVGKPFGKNGLLVTNEYPVFNFLGAYNHLSYSEERPCSTRGGGCCSSSDEEDKSGGLFTYHKKSSVPNTGGSPPPAFM